MIPTVCFRYFQLPEAALVTLKQIAQVTKIYQDAQVLQVQATLALNLLQGIFENLQVTQSKPFLKKSGSRRPTRPRSSRNSALRLCASRLH
uniref:Uncharacterized protein n=1 Tax=Spironucleus salmonicida TaxID=348837 RepID=V6LS52_9EUKA|eukprot:EST47088.1 Hypothetical protein SS50377_fx074 [Spironucleus salmonicida]